jgi:putative methyltransferase (TIGR04325 family)
LRVLDFGGAFGTSYHLVRDALPGQYRWAVVETPTFVGFASEVDTPDLRMFATIDEAKAWLGEVDLLYSSSALQYVPDPLSMVDRLLDTRPACAAWLRSAFSATDPVVVLQRSRLRDNGPGPLPEGITDVEVHYPRTYVSLPDFMSRFQPEYRLVIAYGNGTPALELGGVMATEGSNYLFVRQDH